MQVNSIVQAVLFSFLLVLVSVEDMKKREIPPLFCVGIALCALLNFKAENLLGLGIPMVLLITAAWIYPDQLGGGDIKLTAAVSFVLGFTATAYGVILGFSLELAVFIILKRRRKFTKQEAKEFPMPLAPFLTIGFLVTYFINFGGLMR
ncbi:A24 family peptidase [Anaerotignum sp.]|uniref:A24 family peptidase n=1 Tax=Anaerotignum sp. TaxID=2039241 RepID=UPI0028976084|nr:A24 family peptidase [Anaerotignum sp.]